jgi:2-polyprenyl-6-methoxyphenol hydroxylase-like FAD-dependent oxidoreductase
VTPRDDRQVLVVGEGVAGLAVAAALRGAGYDPVLLAVDDREPPSRLAALHPVGRSLFDRLTVGRDQAAEATPVALAADGDSGADSPVGVAADALDATLAASVPGDAVRDDGIRSLERDGGALRVGFASGVREWFDLVVAADGPGSSVRALRGQSVDTTEATQVEARVPTSGTAVAARGVWTDDGLCELLPDPGGGALVRVTTDRSAGDEPGTRARCALDRFEWAGAREPVGAVARTVTQSSGDGRWADGRVAYCGPAACPQAPATGLRTTLALADARVLADELLAGSSVETAVASYARRRRRHLEALRESASGDRGAGAAPADGALAAVGRDRSVGVGGCRALSGTDRL